MKRAVPSLLRSMNSTAVLKALIDKPGMSRARLARELNISPPTIIEIVNKLIDKKIVREVGRCVSIGRPASELGIDTNAGQIVCLDVGGTNIRAARFNLHKQLMEFRKTKTANSSREAVIAQIVETVKELLIPSVSYASVVVGIPGYVVNGTVSGAPNLPDWNEVSLHTELYHRLGIPIAIENDVNLAALGEARFGIAKEVRNVVFLSLGTGIGAGIVIDGHLMRGSVGAAGEIAFMLTGLDDLDKSFGTVGAFETATNMRALSRYWSDLTESSAEPAEVVEEARQGNTKALSAIERWTQYLGIGVVAIGAILNPDVIVIGGGGSNAFDLIAERLRTYVKTHLPSAPVIAKTQLGDEAALWGGVSIGIELLIDHLTQAD
ncbi:MAG: ROK family transcriptional regulator [Alicyclobacillus sp.]|nr:ROK family transcriptional regulator [Alicyclobacillus sp.]